MLASGQMVGFVLTRDYQKARAFYEDKLGFEFVSQDQFALVMKAGGHDIRVSKVADFTPRQSTVIGFAPAMASAYDGLLAAARPPVMDIELKYILVVEPVPPMAKMPKVASDGVAWLTERGVAFEKYPFIQDKKRGIWTTPGGSRVAWFKDADGNVLSVSQH